MFLFLMFVYAPFERISFPENKTIVENIRDTFIIGFQKSGFCSIFVLYRVYKVNIGNSSKWDSAGDWSELTIWPISL